MKKVFLISAYLFVSVLVGILWYYPIVPYIFYITAADDVMRDQMWGDLIEFYGIAQYIQVGDTGYPSLTAERIAAVMWQIGNHGIWVWILLGIFLGCRRAFFPAQAPANV